MFGLDWGADQARALARFEGLSPVLRSETELEWLLFDLATRLRRENAFCPSALRSAEDRDQDRVTLSFQDGGVVSVHLSFGYGFDAIGQDPDRLSELAMAAYARAEWASLVTDMACRYGAPRHAVDGLSRSGTWQLVGSAMYIRPDGAPLSLSFGHDAIGLVGRLRCLAPSSSDSGI